MHATARLASTVVSALAALSLAGCEAHPPSIAKDAPAHLHAALSGDISAQAFVAACYAMAGGCIGQNPDPALACAWYGVRLASRSPALSLRDVDTFKTACAGLDTTGRQRAAIALDDLTRRVYRRPGSTLPPSVGELPSDRLYPSIGTVYDRVNLALVRAHKPRLGALSLAQPTRDERVMAWTACSPTVCLRGQTPGFGGGLLRYRVEVKIDAATDPTAATALAAELAATGLDSPGVAADLATAAGIAPIATPAVCWMSGRGAGSGEFAEAAPAPCPAP